MNVHKLPPLQRSVTIRTPENIELTYPLAGAGSRVAAYLVDLILLWFVLIIAQNLIAILIFAVFSPGAGKGSEGWFAAILTLLMFSIINGYFMLFEWWLNGQTPGKRFVGIRVMKEGGYALRFWDTAVRNLMRIVDFLPLFYAIGLTSILVSARSQRLGDMLAGTLLVLQHPFRKNDLLENIPAVDTSQCTWPAEQLQAIPTDIINVCVQFFDARQQLAPYYRQQIAGELVVLIEQTAGLKPDATQSAETFLAVVIRKTSQTPQA